MKHYKVVLFDLDGTLTDPKLGITKSVQYALNSFGINEPDLENLVPFIGPPLLYSFKEFYGFSEGDAQKAIAYYREYFAETGIFENAVFPGIPELLKGLRRDGKVLLVATSKPTVYSERILTHFQLIEHFSAVVGSNLDGTRIEKAEVIAYAIEQYLREYDTRDMVMVGDRKHDIAGAQHHGVDVIAVGFGYGSSEELAEARPTYLAHSVQELKALLLG